VSALTAPTSVYATGIFWERLWRMSGINFAVLLIIAYLIYGSQPQVGASAESVVAFYQGDRARILIATVLSGMAVLNLMWFVAALRTALANAEQDGWGGAAMAAGAMVGGMFILLIALGATLAYSIAGSGNAPFASVLNDFAWACVVLSSFPRAMLIMSSAFGLWRSGLISNALFAAGVAVIVLVLLGGTTWMAGGVWAPDGIYSRFVSPLLGLAWLLVVSRVMLARSPATGAGW
jgi:hypothetical protein